MLPEMKMPSLKETVQAVGRFLKVMITLFATFVGTAFVAVMLVYFYFARDLPNITTISDYHPYLISQVFGSDGTRIGEFWNEERRYLVPIEEIPPLLISSFIAAEDARFFEHHGVDFRGTLRAFLANFKAGGIKQGGSTITQQVTRSLLLSRQKSYTRKIKEAILATRLERYLSKDQILYLYLNQIYFGNRAYGVKAAAEDYFHKDLKDLNIAEMAILAGLPRAPEFYSPLRHPDKARERQEYVLTRMVEQGVINDKERLEALATNIKVYMQGVDKESNHTPAPYFVEYIREMLLKKYGEDKLYYGGLKIYTQLDPVMQKAGNEAVQRGLEVVDRRRNGWRGTLDHVAPSNIPSEKEKIHQQILQEERKQFVMFPPVPESKETPTPIEIRQIYSAIVTGFQGIETQIAVGRTPGVIPKRDITHDPKTLAYNESFYINDPSSVLKVGDIIRVRAEGDGHFSFYQDPLVQGALYAQETATGFVKTMVGGYDFVKSEFNRTMDSVRQPGSSFKPFVYAAALDKGYMFKTPLIDSPFTIRVGDEMWSPKNYDSKYRGMTTVHNAIVHSLNVPTARVALNIHLPYLTAYIRKMGITTPIMKYPSMALGANGMHLYEMVAAYSTFPNHGIYHAPTFIQKIVDQDENVLEEYKPDQTPEIVDQAQKTDDAEEGFNKSLFDANQKFIESDGLKLSKQDLKVLYGDNIPEGYIITPETSYLMVKLMTDVVQTGTGQRVKKLGKPVAGKTGTSNDETDTWFIGYVPDLAAGVWVGYDSIRSLGKGEQGGRTAAPIFLDFMQTATKDWEPKEFAMPETLKGKDLFATAGGSAKFSDSKPAPVAAPAEGGTSQDRSADFQEADMEGLAGHQPSAIPVGPPEENPSEEKPEEY